MDSPCGVTVPGVVILSDDFAGMEAEIALLGEAVTGE